MIAAFHQNFQEHQGLIYNLESKQNSYIDEKIKENLKNMGHLSFSEFEQLKDVYRNQIDDNVYKFSREISQKVDDLVEVIYLLMFLFR